MTECGCDENVIIKHPSQGQALVVWVYFNHLDQHSLMAYFDQIEGYVGGPYMCIRPAEILHSPHIPTSYLTQARCFIKQMSTSVNCTTKQLATSLSTLTSSFETHNPPPPKYHTMCTEAKLILELIFPCHMYLAIALYHIYLMNF